MSKFRFTLNMLALAIFTLTIAATTQAQATRTWVSGVGDDVNPCSRTAPCKTYAGAISKTADKGRTRQVLRELRRALRAQDQTRRKMVRSEVP